MSKYLKDVEITNVRVTLANVEEIANLFDRLWHELAALARATPGLAPLYVFMIRYDGQGVKVYDPATLMDVFKMARRVERIIFSIETDDSRNSNRLRGRFAEMVLDRLNPHCLLTVSSDTEDWMESTFSRLRTTVEKMAAWHRGMGRSKPVMLLVQLLGVFLIFVVSVGAARAYEAKYPGKDAFLTVFLFSLLMLSNVWTAVGPALNRLLARTFPNVGFVKPGRETAHWGVQAGITFVATIIVTYVLDRGIAMGIALLQGVLP